MKIHLPVCGPVLPVHPRTGRSALGLRRNGAPIWPVLGASPDDPSNDDGDGDGGDDDQDGDGGDQGDGDKPADLGDAGKKALDVMKGQRNKARSDLRAWSGLAREHGVNTVEELRNLLKGKKPDGGDAPDPDQIRREARAEADREVAKERLLDKIEAKASRFADPADAPALLLRENDPDDFLDGTKVDAAAVADALDELLKRKPYLAVTKTGRDPKQGPKPDKSQGNRGGSKISSREAAIAEAEKRFGKKPAVT